MDGREKRNSRKKKTVVGHLEAVMLFAKSIQETENSTKSNSFPNHLFTIWWLFAYAQSPAYKRGRHWHPKTNLWEKSQRILSTNWTCLRFGKTMSTLFRWSEIWIQCFLHTWRTTGIRQYKRWMSQKNSHWVLECIAPWDGRQQITFLMDCWSLFETCFYTLRFKLPIVRDKKN